MELTEIAREQFEDIELNTGLSECTPRTYSGRAMYGEQCFGIDAPNMREVAKFLCGLTNALGEDGFEDAVEFAARMETDSMGLGIVAYFPGVTFADDQDEDSEL